MLKRLSLVQPATIISCIALFVALSGASYAAVKLPKNSVGEKQLKKNAVTSKKVKDGSLTSADIKLSSLGTVPNAASADSAKTASSAESAKTLTGGVSVKRIFARQAWETPETEIYNDGALILSMTCDASGALEVYGKSTTDSGLAHWIVNGDSEQENDYLSAGDAFTLLTSGSGDSTVGQLVYSSPVNTVTVDFAGEEDSGILGIGDPSCAFVGTAIKS